MSTLLEIDGRFGEGGGQILRSSLALSAATGRGFRIRHIRGRRRRSGLLRQHLAAVRAARDVCDAQVEGAELGSSELIFRPGPVGAGAYRSCVGSAGSCLLVLQTVLPPLLKAEGSSTLVLEGGTHNPLAPPFEFFELAFVPQLARMGGRVEIALVRPGYFPAGGGEVHVRIEPGESRPYVLLERGAERRHRVVISLAHLPEAIAEKEWQALRRLLPWGRDRLTIVHHPDSAGPGNALLILIEFEHVTEVVTAFGMKNVPSHRVANLAAQGAQRYLAASAPVGDHLADQLLLPMALLAGGRFRSLSPSLHTRTNAQVIDWFLGEGTVELRELGKEDWEVEVRPPPCPPP